MSLRYVVIGAGAVGGAIGGRLVRAGRDVLLVARGEHLAALRRTGLRLRTPEEDVTFPVTAVGGPEEVELRPSDVLVLATKTQQAQAALAAWADAPVPGAGPHSTAGEVLPVLTALNGVASETIALRYFRRVVGVCVWMPSVHLVPGEVMIRGSAPSGVLHLGPVPPGQPDPRLDEVAADLTAADFAAPRPSDVMAWKYRKLLSNIGNAFQALVGGNGDWRPLARAATAEARDVLDAAGISYVSDQEERVAWSAGVTMRPVPGVPEDTGGSTWQSLTRGTGNVETDYLNGEIAYLAHALDRSAPLNAAVARLTRQAAATARRPGELGADELGRALDLAQRGTSAALPQ